MVSNAMKFTHRGGKVVVRASIRKQATGNALHSRGALGSAEQLCRLAFGSQTDLRKFSPPESTHQSLSGEKEVSGEKQLLRIEVEDSGAGISKVRTVLYCTSPIALRD